MTAPLRIGVVCFPSLGGSGVVASELACGLAARGHEVHVMASALPGRVVTSERLHFHPVLVPTYPVFEHGPYTIAVASKIIDVARAHRLDLVHVHYAVPHAACAYLARQALGGALRVVTSLHGTDVTRVGVNPSYAPVTRFAVRASDALIAPSEYLATEARRGLEIPDDQRIEVVPNFVNTERFTPGPERLPNGGPVLFHVSNFRPVKRTGDLLDLLQRVRRSANARMVLVGDGPDRPAAEARAAALGLGEHVKFLGWRGDFTAELRQADAFVLSSESESFGVAALEALSAGVPVFAYRVGGLPELVTDEVGRLVDPFDVDALAGEIAAAVGSPVRQRSLARAARAHAVAQFRREPAIARYESIFHRLVQS